MNQNSIGDLLGRILVVFCLALTVPGCGEPQPGSDGPDAVVERHEPAAEETMTILYTSGSTGRPKGVVIS